MNYLFPDDFEELEELLERQLKPNGKSVDQVTQLFLRERASKKTLRTRNTVKASAASEECEEFDNDE